MKTLNIATESIAFQSKAFFRSLVALIKDYRTSDKSTLTRANVLRNISMTISEHTNLLISVRESGANDSNAFIIFPTINPYNVISDRNLKNEVVKIIQSANRKRFPEIVEGWIDPVSATVGGYFANIPHAMWVGSDLLDSKLFTEEEVAAVIIHETGHAFTMLQFVADTVISNIVLEEAARKYAAEPDYKKSRIILDQASIDVGDNERTWSYEITDTTGKDLGARVFLMHSQAGRLGADNKRKYTYNNCEELADIFAVRHGAGEAVMSFRAKMAQNKLVTGTARFNRTSTYFFLMTRLVMSVAASAVGALVAAHGIPTAGAIIIVANLVSAVGAVKEMATNFGLALDAPDLASNRTLITKVRNQMINALKDNDLPADARKELLKGIDAGFVILSDEINEAETTFIQLLVDFFDRGRVDRRLSREYTDRLEMLTNNELFAKAYKLTNTATNS